MTDLFAASSAIISPCGRYRYRLEREGPGDGRTVVIMVNPSTADAEQDDATIRKLKGFGARNGWGRIIVGNLFAYRATDVRELATADDAIGPVNDVYLGGMINEADRVIVAWGPVSKVPKRLRERWRDVYWEMPGTKPVFSIGTTAMCGHPKHPLMLPYDSPIIEWRPASVDGRRMAETTPGSVRSTTSAVPRADEADAQMTCPACHINGDRNPPLLSWQGVRRTWIR